MKIRDRISGIVIKNRKLLMLTHEKGPHSLLWTPGGGVEKGESDLDCLRRELKEELDVELVSQKFLIEILAKSPLFGNASRNKVYSVEIKGKIKIEKGLKAVWCNLEDYKKGKYKMIPVTQESVVKYLVDNRIWK
jgi:8-oxo-dGTP pyrophosphatase MutT (NUDIX family)